MPTDRISTSSSDPATDPPRGRVITEDTVVDDSVSLREFGVAGVSGLVGMVAMTPVLLLAWLVGVLSPGAFTELSQLVGFGNSLPVGVLVFVAGGMTTLPLLFVALAMFLPGETVARKGVVYGSVVWTGFAIAFFTGQAGLALAGYLALTLVAHWAYGYVLGSAYERYAAIPVYEV